MNNHQIIRAWVKLSALLLIALWLPASSHEWLESSGFIHSTEHGDQDVPHEAADGYCQLGQGRLFLKVPVLSAQPWLTVIADAIFALPLPEPLLANARLYPSTAPPELAKTWQFSQRTALPSRAPSGVV